MGLQTVSSCHATVWCSCHLDVFVTISFTFGEWIIMAILVALKKWQENWASLTLFICCRTQGGSIGSGGRAGILEAEGSWFDSQSILHGYVSKCSWERHWTPNCTYEQVGALPWMVSSSIEVWMGQSEVNCNVKRFWEKRYINAFNLPFALCLP